MNIERSKTADRDRKGTKTADKDRRTAAEELMKKLTLDEKIGMVHGAQLFQTAGAERLGIPPLKMSDGPMGVRQEFHPASWVPVGNSDDAVSYLPCNSALAASWNREFAAATGSVLGEEARGRGKDVILGPGINIKRSPLCGRNFEYFSEDPYLTKELAAPFIQGVQKWDVAACVKHFAANNQETERLWVDVEVDEKALREIYLPAFYDALKRGGSHTIMAAYNRLNGDHCYYQHHLLDEILDSEWGYDGVVISDWGGVHDTALAAESRLDIEMSVTDNFDDYYLADPLKERIEKGEISEQELDEKVVRILMLLSRLHMLGKEPRRPGSYNTPEHRQSALDTARESVVLLKNENRVLPLAAEQVEKLLVIGENADCTHADGGGSAEIKALYEITPLLGIKSLLGGNTEVRYVPGYIRDEEQTEKETGDVNWQETSLEDGGGRMRERAGAADEAVLRKREALRKEAAELAARYEHVVFVGGLNHEYDSEGRDRADMKLPYDQDLLIREILQANPNAVIVLMGGSPVEMEDWIRDTKTLVWCWYAGMEGGRALAEVLFGKVNPSGKLPETFYKKHTDCSAHAVGEFPGDAKVRYKEGVFVGYRYNDTFGVEPRFCFGHGLSYTTFAYSNPEVKWKEGRYEVTCDLENTGTRAGKETVQVYLAPAERAEDEPVQQLRGFEKIELEPGEKKQVRILAEPLKMESAGYSAWEAEQDAAVPGMTEVRIGASSRDIRLTVRI